MDDQSDLDALSDVLARRTEQNVRIDGDTIGGLRVVTSQHQPEPIPVGYIDDEKTIEEVVPGENSAYIVAFKSGGLDAQEWCERLKEHRDPSHYVPVEVVGEDDFVLMQAAVPVREVISALSGTEPFVVWEGRPIAR